MKQNRVIYLLLILSCMVVLTGCWDNRELDELSVPLIAAFDLAEKKEKQYPEDKYLVSVGIPRFYEKTNKDFDIESASGNMIGETRGRSNVRIGEEMILGQLQILLFGEDLLEEESIVALTDIITRNPKVKASVFLAIVKGRAVDLMTNPIEKYPNSAEYIKMLLENIRYTNFIPNPALFDFNRDVFTNEAPSLIPYLAYGKDEIHIAGSCIVDGRLIARLGREETETLVMLKGYRCKGTLSFPVIQDGKRIDDVSVLMQNARKVKVKRDGDQYTVDILIKLTGNIVEHRNQKPVQDGVDIDKLSEKSLEALIKKRAETIVDKMQNTYKTDIMSLSSRIRAHTRKKLSKNELNEIIQKANINININVKVDIKHQGGKT